MKQKLPYDILHLISLRIFPKQFLCSKELVAMYPDLNLYTTTNYYDLYRKFLDDGGFICFGDNDYNIYY